MTDVRVRVAWALFGLTVLVTVAHVILLVASRRPVLSAAVIAEGFPLVTMGAVGGAAVGALIVSRYPGHPIGWLFVVGQLLSEVGLALGVYGHSALTGQLGGAPGGHLAVWLSVQTGGLFVVALLAVLLLLAPDGTLVSPRWRWVLAAPILGVLASTAAVATVSPNRMDANGHAIGGTSATLEGVIIGALLAVGVGVVAGAASLWLRLRRAAGDERQRLRWVVTAALALALGVVLNIAFAALRAPSWLQPLPVMAAYASVPVFMGIAILRYRLYDIDVFLNRAIVLAVLSGFVTVGYVGLVVLIGSVSPLTHGAFWPSMIATAVVAIAFQPVRKRARRLAGRIVYGVRATPYLELAEFSERLQGAPSTPELLRRVAEAVVRAVGATSCTLRADIPGGARHLVSSPEGKAVGPGSVRTIRVLHQDEVMGELSVNLAPGRSLEAEEERLLSDFSVQLGHVLRNLRLESTLAQRLEELHRSAAALSASAHRLSLAQDAERQRFERDLGRSVVPHLRKVELGLTEVLQSEVDVTSVPRLQSLQESTQQALEELRTLTRGIFPAQLARQGLPAALEGHLARSGGGALQVDVPPGRRYRHSVESTAYFCVVEVLRETGSAVDVHLQEDDERLRLTMRSLAPAPEPMRLMHLRDRAAGIGGQLMIADDPDTMSVTLELPLESTSGLQPHLAQPS